MYSTIKMAGANTRNLPLYFTYTCLYSLMSTTAKVSGKLEHKKSTIQTFWKLMFAPKPEGQSYYHHLQFYWLGAVLESCSETQGRLVILASVLVFNPSFLKLLWQSAQVFQLWRSPPKLSIKWRLHKDQKGHAHWGK